MLQGKATFPRTTAVYVIEAEIIEFTVTNVRVAFHCSYCLGRVSSGNAFSFGKFLPEKADQQRLCSPSIGVAIFADSQV